MARTARQRGRKHSRTPRRERGVARRRTADKEADEIRKIQTLLNEARNISSSFERGGTRRKKTARAPPSVRRVSAKKKPQGIRAAKPRPREKPAATTRKAMEKPVTKHMKPKAVKEKQIKRKPPVSAVGKAKTAKAKPVEKECPPGKVGPLLETNVDRLLQWVNQKSKVSVREASKRFDVSEEKIEEWGTILEEHELIIMHYPKIGKPVLRSHAAATKPHEKKGEKRRKNEK